MHVINVSQNERFVCCGLISDLKVGAVGSFTCGIIKIGTKKKIKWYLKSKKVWTEHSMSYLTHFFITQYTPDEKKNSVHVKINYPWIIKMKEELLNRRIHPLTVAA